MITFTYDNPTEANIEVEVTFTNTETSKSCTANLMPVWFDPDPLVDGDEYFSQEATDSKFAAISITYDILQQLK
jgi:hypothetical protein